jgi:hypothetical protein
MKSLSFFIRIMNGDKDLVLDLAYGNRWVNRASELALRPFDHQEISLDLDSNFGRKRNWLFPYA